MNPHIYGNYHTHTYRCGHASGDVAEYVREAKKAGFRELGMSDHTPLPDDWMGSIRMKMDELEGYTKAIEEASTEAFPVLKGAECEAVSRYYGFYREELLGRLSYRFLIGAVHWFEYRGEWLHAFEITSTNHLRAYADTLIAAMETGPFAFFAHPDHFTANRPWDRECEACSRDILAAAKATKALLEINGNGFRKPLMEGEAGFRRPFPHPRFWELAREYGLSVICNSDAHRPEEVGASVDLCAALAEEKGLPLTTRLASPPGIV